MLSMFCLNMRIELKEGEKAEALCRRVFNYCYRFPEPKQTLVGMAVINSHPNISA